MIILEDVDDFYAFFSYGVSLYDPELFEGEFQCEIKSKTVGTYYLLKKYFLVTYVVVIDRLFVTVTIITRLQRVNAAVSPQLRLDPCFYLIEKVDLYK